MRAELSVRDSANELIDLEDRQQDCHDDREHDEAHDDDQERLEHAQHHREQAVHLAFLMVRGALEHVVELAAGLAARNQVNAHGGEQLRLANDRPIAPPSRTRTAASSTAARIGRLAMTEALIRSASRAGTPLAVRMLSVRVKRAVLSPRVTRPKIGARSSQPMHAPADVSLA